MTKKQESKKVLELLGMPTEQQSDICCYSLLALLNLSSSSSWSPKRRSTRKRMSFSVVRPVSRSAVAASARARTMHGTDSPPTLRRFARFSRKSGFARMSRACPNSTDSLRPRQTCGRSRNQGRVAGRSRKGDFMSIFNLQLEMKGTSRQ